RALRVSSAQFWASSTRCLPRRVTAEALRLPRVAERPPVCERALLRRPFPELRLVVRLRRGDLAGVAAGAFGFVFSSSAAMFDLLFHGIGVRALRGWPWRLRRPIAPCFLDFLTSRATSARQRARPIASTGLRRSTSATSPDLGAPLRAM